MKSCPICTRPSILARSVAESEKIEDAGLWYYCSCGVIFQKDSPEPVIKDKQYIENHNVVKEYEDISIELGRTYAPIIEQITYGRKMLDVGFGTDNNMQFFKERGWITFGIETNKDTEESERIIKSDFETTDKLYKENYDLVWMAHVLEKFRNPIFGLERAREILSDGGVLFIATPDIEFQYSTPLPEWQHWKRKENYVMWSEKALCRELEKLGFNIITKYRNYYKRFGYYHNLHIIAQKIYY